MPASVHKQALCNDVMHMHACLHQSAKLQQPHNEHLWGSSPAERVKVVVRVRPPRGNETPGAISINPDYRGMVIYRECVPSSVSLCCRILHPCLCGTEHTLLLRSRSPKMAFKPSECSVL